MSRCNWYSPGIISERPLPGVISMATVFPTLPWASRGMPVAPRTLVRSSSSSTTETSNSGTWTNPWPILSSRERRAPISVLSWRAGISTGMDMMSCSFPHPRPLRTGRTRAECTSSSGRRTPPGTAPVMHSCSSKGNPVPTTGRRSSAATSTGISMMISSSGTTGTHTSSSGPRIRWTISPVSASSLPRPGRRGKATAPLNRLP